jgi:adenylate cyclase
MNDREGTIADDGPPRPEPPSSDERQRRARLANIRQELLAPVNAIAGYAAILSEEVLRLDLEGMAEDVGRIVAAAEALGTLVERLLDSGAVAEAAAGHDAADLQEQLRHDLRNPLNAIKGYGEMLLEDIEDLGGTALRPDLERLLLEAAQLLASLDVIVNFSRLEQDEAGADPASAMAASLVRTIGPRQAEGGPARERGRILVVDDNASNRDLLARRLAREGHQTLVSASGREALQILEHEGVDLILLDLMMPDMNGLEVLERLKADATLREVPVIMISGLHEVDSVIRCIEAGAEDYLTKPFDPVLLRARINACLERKRWHDREREYLARLEAERARSEALLHNILPAQIVTRLNGGELLIADRVEEVTILFCDLVGFTQVASRMAPGRVVDNLNRIFSAFDALSRDLGVEKIKTVGDAYMAAAGLPEARADHAEAAAELALGMLETLEELNRAWEVPFQVRIGLHSGPVVAGIIGTHRFIYDVWGDTVNVASRLEAHGLPGRVHVSEQMRRALEHRYELEPRGVINIRGRGKMATAVLTGRKAAALGMLYPRPRSTAG